MNSLAIGIDLGATVIKGVLLNAAGEKLEESKEETQELDEGHWKAGVLRAIAQLKTKMGAQAIVMGLSAPGLANQANTCIAFMPGRLRGIENFDWSKHVGQRVWVLNDAHAALMAEATFGVARGSRNVVMLTLGTGVGGAILVEGRLYLGQGQMAGHVGHMTVDALSEFADVTGMPGSIEDAIGNVTVVQRSEGRFQDTGQLVNAVRAGDKFAVKVWDTSIRKLAATLASLVNLLSPELIVLGGGITNAGKDLFSPLAGYMEKFEWRPGGKKTPIVQSHFYDQAGAYGAAAFAVSKTSDEM